MSDKHSRYGATFDALADDWARLENDHDLMHPNRDLCGGVGRCPMMREAYDREQQMISTLRDWRIGDAR